jgi:hypothetical protein
MRRKTPTRDESVAIERLEALVDGTVPRGERSELLAAVARSPEATARLADMLATLRETEHLSPERERIRQRAHRRVRIKWPLLWLVTGLAAAGIATVVLRSSTTRVLPVVVLARESVSRQSPSTSLALGEWNRAPSVSRGSAPAGGATARLFSLGVRFAQLEWAAVQSDSGAMSAALLALRLEAAANPRALGAVMIVENQAERAPERDRLARNLRETEATVWGGWFDLGVWTELARLETLTQDSTRAQAFFSADGQGMRVLRDLLREARENGRASTETISVLTELAEHPSPDRQALAAIRRQLEQAIAAGAR